MSVYYNEWDPYAAEWLRNLIEADLIALGDVDTRSIKDVQATDLRGYRQCHFFAGIGVWSYALRRAGWSDIRQIWTGSCPCQPFSAAGARKGFSDDRHLWPEFFRLIRECRPGVVIGEQVASKDGLGWFDTVSTDLEAEAYTVGALDTCAASVGAPHIRQRLYWMAYSDRERRARKYALLCRRRSQQGGVEATRRGAPGRVGYTSSARGGRYARPTLGTQAQGGRQGVSDGCVGDELGTASSARGLADAVPAGRAEWRACAGVGQVAGSGGIAGGMADGGGERLARWSEQPAREERPPAKRDCDADRLAHSNSRQSSDRELQRSGRHVQDPLAGFWSGADWLQCTDGKARPVESGTFPLAHGAPARMGRLRSYGNALVEPQAEEFARVMMECLP